MDRALLAAFPWSTSSASFVLPARAPRWREMVEEGEEQTPVLMHSIVPSLDARVEMCASLVRSHEMQDAIRVYSSSKRSLISSREKLSNSQALRNRSHTLQRGGNVKSARDRRRRRTDINQEENLQHDGVSDEDDDDDDDNNVEENERSDNSYEEDAGQFSDSEEYALSRRAPSPEIGETQVRRENKTKLAESDVLALRERRKALLHARSHELWTQRSTSQDSVSTALNGDGTEKRDEFSEMIDSNSSPHRIADSSSVQSSLALESSSRSHVPELLNPRPVSPILPPPPASTRLTRQRNRSSSSISESSHMQTIDDEGESSTDAPNISRFLSKRPRSPSISPPPLASHPGRGNSTPLLQHDNVVSTSVDRARMPKERPRTLCKFWREGKCLKGSDCPFSHDFEPKTRREMCRYHFVGKCEKGDMCPFSHNTKEFPCRFFHLWGSCRETAESCRFSHAEIAPDQKEKLRMETDRLQNVGRIVPADAVSFVPSEENKMDLDSLFASLLPNAEADVDADLTETEGPFSNEFLPIDGTGSSVYFGLPSSYAIDTGLSLDPPIRSSGEEMSTTRESLRSMASYNPLAPVSF